VVPVPAENRDAAIRSLSYYRGITEPHAIYKVTSSTNLGGVVLPLTFLWEGYSFVGKKTLVGKAEAKVRSIEQIEILNPFPRSSDNTTNIWVGDYRFCNSSQRVYFVNYTATNAMWITDTNDPYLKQAYAVELRKVARTLPFTSWPRIVLRGVFVFLAVSPLVLVVRTFRRPRRND
jgi:hypothetical protein